MSAARGFTAIPNAVVRDRSIPPGTRLLYGIILSYAWGSTGRCTRKSDDLAKEAGVGRTAFFEGVALLQARGLLTVEKVRHRGGWANAYVPTPGGVTVPDHEEVVRDPDDGSSAQEDGGSSATRTQKKTKGEEDSEADASEIAREQELSSMTYRGKKVPTSVIDTARRAVLYFASRTGQTLRVVDGQGRPTESMKRVVGAMLSHPELREPEFAKRAVDYRLAAPWWQATDTPGVGVVFGPNVVEQTVELARRDEPPAPKGSGPGGRDSASDQLARIRDRHVE